MTESLGDLIRRCLVGDSRAQKAIYDEFAPKVYRLAVRMVGEAHAADVTQEAFVKMFRALSKFQGNARFSTWLYRIAVNECLQHLRRTPKPHQQLPVDVPDPSARADKRLEQAELLQRAMEELDEKLRAVFLLREVEGLSYDEIANVLEIPAGTVASQLNRARAELRDYLTKAMSE